MVEISPLHKGAMMTKPEFYKWMKRNHPCIDKIGSTKLQCFIEMKPCKSMEDKIRAASDFSILLKRYVCSCDSYKYGLACLCHKEELQPESNFRELAGMTGL